MDVDANKLLYRRVLLKISGEGLKGDKGELVCFDKLRSLAQSLTGYVEAGLQLGMVVGGGNFMRFRDAPSGIPVLAKTIDQIGMLGTVANALALRDAFIEAGNEADVWSPVSIPGVVKHFDSTTVVRNLNQGHIALFAFGTGNPFFSTDTAATIRALEIEAQLLLKATQVDGVYSADPRKVKSASRYSQLSWDEAIDQKLGVMDQTAMCMCRTGNLPVRIFAMTDMNVLGNILCGSDEGTLIQN